MIWSINNNPLQIEDYSFEITPELHRWNIKAYFKIIKSNFIPTQALKLTLNFPNQQIKDIYLIEKQINEYYSRYDKWNQKYTYYEATSYLNIANDNYFKQQLTNSEIDFSFNFSLSNNKINNSSWNSITGNIEEIKQNISNHRISKKIFFQNSFFLDWNTLQKNNPLKIKIPVKWIIKPTATEIKYFNLKLFGCQKSTDFSPYKKILQFIPNNSNDKIKIFHYNSELIFIRNNKKEQIPLIYNTDYKITNKHNNIWNYQLQSSLTFNQKEKRYSWHYDPNPFFFFPEKINGYFKDTMTVEVKNSLVKLNIYNHFSFNKDVINTPNIKYIELTELPPKYYKSWNHIIF